MASSKRNPRKKLRFGIEFELFTLDEQGYITSGADRLIARVKKHYPNIEIKEEVGKNMIEITTPPSLEVPDAMLKAMDDFEAVAACAAEEKLLLYAYGTYPGAFTPEFHTGKRFRAQEKILGKQRFAIAGRCVGLHIHYSLPWGVFNRVEKIIKPLIRSKNMQMMINIYNLCIAMDPALFTLAQSSPFYQGEQLAKDSRVVFYRGGSDLDSPQGLYANFPEFGALQQYRATNTDILRLIRERFVEWGRLLKGIGRDIALFSKHGSILDNTWNPVKINAHGTMEIRGMDMNHPDIIVAIALMVKYIIKEVQEKFLQIVPSDIGIADPFKREGHIIYIPPDSHVRQVLQRKAAYQGLADDDVYHYVSGLLKLAKEYVPAAKRTLLKPLEEMLETRQTTSDRIIAQAKKLDGAKELTPAEAAKLALALSGDLYKEIVIMKEQLREFLEEKTS